MQSLCDEKEAFVNRIFAEAYKEEKLYPYTEEDYSVMALEIAEDLTLIAWICQRGGWNRTLQPRLRYL